MTKCFNDLVQQLETKQNELKKVEDYLNEDGKRLLETLYEINWHIAFLNTLEELKADEDIKKLINENIDIKFINSFKRFIEKH